MNISETRLNVRLKGILADYVDGVVDSSLYESHSEYVRDLIRKDMTQHHSESEEEIRAKIINGFTQLAQGEYDDQPLEEIFGEAMEGLQQKVDLNG